MRLALASLLITLAPACLAQMSDKAIRVQEVVPASIADVWAAWTTSEGWTAFLGTEAHIELEPGGRFEIYFDPSAPDGLKGSEGCTVLSYLPERMVSFTWNAPPTLPKVREQDHHTIVVVELHPLGDDRTRVTLTHHAWPAEGTPIYDRGGEQWEKTYGYFQRAWPAVLGAMKTHFSEEDGAERDPASGWVYLFTGFSRPDLLKTMTDDERAILSDHSAYLRDLTKRGGVVFAGPCTDLDSPNRGPGIVIIEAGGEDEARSVMENDPAVKHGLFVAELHPLRFSLLRERDAR